MARFGRTWLLPHIIQTAWKQVVYRTVSLSGTITSAAETDIVAGGKTIVLTLSGDSWVTAGATFDGQRQNIINGLTSGGAEANGWNNVVKALQGVAGVVRTTATVVTITLDAQATYDITSAETITVTVPATALVAGTALVASPTFTVNTSGGTLNRFLSLLGAGS